MDEQSALPSVYGVPAWAAVAIGVLGAILGIVVDHFVGSGELTARFAVIYVLGCTVAALAVRHRALFTAVVQPPIILFIAVPVAYITFGDASFSIRSMALNVIPLVNRFPLMLFTTTVVMTIGAIRLVRNRPRRSAHASNRRATAEQQKSRPERAAASARPAAPVIDPETAETERFESPAAARRRQASSSRSLSATGTTGVGSSYSAPPAASPGLSGQAAGWLASVDPLASREPATHEDDRDRLDDNRTAAATARPPRRVPPRTEAAIAPRGPVRYRPDSVTSRGSSWSDPEGAPEPLFDDAALHAARRTRSGRRFQPEPRVPEHPIPSVRYRGEPPLGY